MAKKRAQEMVIIMDESGSMYGKESGVVTAFNRQILSPKNLRRDTLVTFIKFGDDIVTVADGMSVQNMKPLTEKMYTPNGCTREYDAVGFAIDWVNKRKESPNYPYKDADVLYDLITDGYENSSEVFNHDDIVQKIANEKSKPKTEGKRNFIIHADYSIDRKRIADDLGISRNNTQIFISGLGGYDALYQSVQMAVDDMCVNDGSVGADWHERSGNIMVGGMRLGDVVKKLDSYQKIFDTVENSLTSIEVSGATDGYTTALAEQYNKISTALHGLNVAFGKAGGNTVVDLILNFVKSKENQLENLKKIVAKTEMQKLLNANEILFGKFDNGYDALAMETIRENLLRVDTYHNEIFSSISMPQLSARIINQYRRADAIGTGKFTTFKHESFDKIRAQIIDESDKILNLGTMPVKPDATTTPKDAPIVNA